MEGQSKEEYIGSLRSFHTIEYCCSTSNDTNPWNYLDSSCGNITYNPNSPSGSIYGANLNLLLYNLSSHASRTDNNGFYNFSTGDDPSNKVYGLFLCRGDVSTDVCKECVADAHTRLLHECPNQTAAIVWYDECLVRFSDQTIFSKADLGENLTRRNPFDVPGPDWDKFIIVLINLLHNAADEAANHAINCIEKSEDPENKRSLNWSRRYNIIGGIAKGLLYLHEDSRLRIVHRDLKVSNILLDGNMSPKIADFGMAKICGVDQYEGNTNRIAGTVGYMAPEYTRWGQFSLKSDVFSFGVVILEIVTGKKSSDFHQFRDSEDLLSYAWNHWRRGQTLALLDSSVGDSYARNEVIQCIQVGLLCVEEDASKRPKMASVVSMLNPGSVSLPTPHRPAVFRSNGSESRVDELKVDQSNTQRISAPSSVNDASITEPYPR
ncbi:cysteine-rich receptor-like protein kinase 10 [Coffea arabica]|uniref:Cysteine-rich receptor-like protein kinase 10 n=1 Tax=Coffea arabica TaxID=13443 RepID=A0ABM4UEU7_COFAR